MEVRRENFQEPIKNLLLIHLCSSGAKEVPSKIKSGSKIVSSTISHDCLNHTV